MRLTKNFRALAFSSIFFAFFGGFASFQLLLEHVHSLRDSAYTPACNVSVLINCGSNMASQFGSVFGFSNTVFGPPVFVVPAVFGVLLFAGAVPRARWFWGLYGLGIAGGWVFTLWLFWHSIFSTGTLCPWCVVIWFAMTGLFWFSLPYFFVSVLSGGSGNGKSGCSARKTSAVVAVIADTLDSWKWVLTALTLIVLALLAQLRLDWVSELLRFLG